MTESFPPRPPEPHSFASYVWCRNPNYKLHRSLKNANQAVKRTIQNYTLPYPERYRSPKVPIGGVVWENVDGQWVERLRVPSPGGEVQ